MKTPRRGQRGPWAALLSVLAIGPGAAAEGLLEAVAGDGAATALVLRRTDPSDTAMGMGTLGQVQRTGTPGTVEGGRGPSQSRSNILAEAPAVDAPSVGADLDRLSVRRAVGRQHQALRDCYTTLLRTEPRVEGRLELELYFNAAARVTAVEVVTSPTPNADFAACVVRAFSAVALDAPAGRSFRVRYPFRLVLP